MNRCTSSLPATSKSGPVVESFSGWRITATVLMVVCAIYASTVRLSGDDFWLQAKIGELIVQDHAIPRTLLFPFTEIASENFNAHEWLLSIAFHYGLVILGEDGMSFLIGGLGLALFIAMARLTYLRSDGNYAIALMGGYVTLLAENYRHVLRPELPALILMAILWNLLEAFKTKPSLRHALWVAFIMVVWANSHGSFILGPVMVGIYSAGLYVDELVDSGSRTWLPSPSILPWFGLLLMTSVCCLINPFGWELIEFVFSFSTTSDASKHLTEWLPTLADTRLLNVRGFWIAIMVWLLLTALIIVGRRRVGAVEWLFFLAFTFLAYRAIRFPVYLGMVAAYIVPACLPADWRQKSHEFRLLKICSAVAFATLMGVVWYGNAAENRPFTLGDKTKFTVPMIKVLSDPSLHGNVLNSMEFGAELIYLSYPRLRPSVDARFDSYGSDYNLFNEALLHNDKLLDEYVERYDVPYLLINHTQFESFKRLTNWTSARWRIYFLDQRAVLLQRSDVRQGRPVS